MRNLITHLRTRGPTEHRTVAPKTCVRLPFTPPPPPYEVTPRAKLVRPYVLHAKKPRPVDRSTLGLQLLLEISREAVAA